MTPPATRSPRADDVWVGDVQVTESNLSGEGWSYAPATSTLALNGFTYEGEGYTGAGIYAEQDLNIVLEGENTVTSTGYYGIYVKEATLTIDGTGTLDVGGTDFGIYTSKWSIGALTIGGSVTVNAKSGDVVSGSSYGIQVAASAEIYGGTITAKAGSANISYGFQTFGDITIEDATVIASGGDVDAGNAYSEGVYVKGGLEPDVGGSLTAEAGTAKGECGYSNGIEVDGDMAVHNGYLTAVGGDATSIEVAFSRGINADGQFSISGGVVIAKVGSAEAEGSGRQGCVG